LVRTKLPKKIKPRGGGGGNFLLVNTAIMLGSMDLAIKRKHLRARLGFRGLLAVGHLGGTKKQKAKADD